MCLVQNIKGNARKPESISAFHLPIQIPICCVPPTGQGLVVKRFFFFFHKNVQFYYLKQGCIKGSPPHRHWTKTACCNAPLAHGRRSWIFHPTSGTSHGINSLHFKVSFQIIPILLSQIQSIYLSVHHPPTLGLPKSVTQFT